VQQHIGPGFTIFPGRLFDLHVTAAADTRNKNHRRRTDLVHVTGIVTRTADHVEIRIPQHVGGFKNSLDEFFIKG